MYVTNLVKCSTTTNKISDYHKDSCFDNIMKEINYIKPKVIFACGKEVYNFLQSKSIENLEFIYHPNYYFTYNTNSIGDYVLRIGEILQKWKFIDS